MSGLTAAFYRMCKVDHLNHSHDPIDKCTRISLRLFFVHAIVLESYFAAGHILPVASIILQFH